MRLILRWTIALPALAVFLSACSDGPISPAPKELGPAMDRVSTLSTIAGPLQARLDGLAQSIAEAATNATVRAELVSAFAASDAPEGKLYFDEAVRSGRETGHHLDARFRPMGGLSKALDGLPDLDFYVARARDRDRLDADRTNIAVIGVVDPDQGHGTAFFSDGHSEPVLDPAAVDADVLIAIHPTERTRDSGTSILTRSTAPRIPIVPTYEECEPGGDDCGGGGGGAYAITRIGGFEVNFSDWIGTAEVEFRGDAYCGTGYQGSGTFRREGVEMYIYYAGGTMISNWAPSVCGSNGRVEVGLYETDPFGIDNYYGSATWYINDNGGGKYFIYGDPNGYATVTWVYVPG